MIRLYVLLGCWSLLTGFNLGGAFHEATAPTGTAVLLVIYYALFAFSFIQLLDTWYSIYEKSKTNGG